jgi:hypothetical protein
MLLDKRRSEGFGEAVAGDGRPESGLPVCLDASAWILGRQAPWAIGNLMNPSSGTPKPR